MDFPVLDPTDDERQRALASALRKQETLGFLGQLSGDRVLSQVGGSLIKSAGQGQELAEQGGQKRLMLALQAQKEKEQRANQQEGLDLRREDIKQRVLDRALSRQDRKDSREEARLAREDAARERDATRKGEKFEKDVQSAGKELQDTADLANDVNALGQTARQPEGDLPGLGVWDSIKPEMFQSSEDIEVQQRIKRLIGQQIKATTGATATPAEMKRIAGSYGLGAGSTEAIAKAGLLKLEADTKRALETRQARFRPEVIGELKQRGGVTADAIGQPPPQIIEVGGKRYRRGPNGEAIPL